ncbi:radical SAM protein [Methanospirillum sp. J.3.6.1-F.2.7.3]|uniref:Radical SAM protein n=1 Tax=Methanospirillum purgamenti TaxID=2834276 RepID=A0A8E7EHM4_9EURY|nr:MULTISPECIES: radical SAM protein [Methanospirillum]MDX8551891.1 radical SAM protein [Methanospirillum hungatei]QVV89157.1 radical SAM protein [Methanospirillum sp. J.3.6.1-F.2.7.3]
MSFSVHMKGYDDPRTLFQIERLYAYKRGLNFPPALVEISPTSVCNHRCRFCYSNEKVSPSFLKKDTMLDLMDQLKEYGVDAVLFQGTGEPLLHKDLPEIIQKGSDNYLLMSLTTNGIKLTPDIQTKILPYLHSLKFSVIDYDPKRYSFLHGCPEDDCKKLVENISHAIEYRKRNNLTLAIYASVCLYKDNCEDAVNIGKFFKNLGVDYIIFYEAFYVSSSPVQEDMYMSLSYSSSKFEEISNEINQLQDDDFHIKCKLKVLQNLNNGIDQNTWKNERCHGIKFYTLIGSDGEVYPCWRAWGQKHLSYGNVYSSKFKEIWEGENRKTVDNYINHTPPEGDECVVCIHERQNEILEKFNEMTDWRHFI